jgi:hypothetical protein
MDQRHRVPGQFRHHRDPAGCRPLRRHRHREFCPSPSRPPRQASYIADSAWPSMAGPVGHIKRRSASWVPLSALQVAETLRRAGRRTVDRPVRSGRPFSTDPRSLVGSTLCGRGC